MVALASLVGTLTLLAALGPTVALAAPQWRSGEYLIAQNAPTETGQQSSQTQSLGDFGIPKLLDLLAGKGTPQLLEQKSEGDIGIFFRERVALIINFMLALVGAMAVIMGMIAGYMYMTAYGSEERSASAKKTIFYAAVGLGMVFGVWTILQLFTTFVGRAGKNVEQQIKQPPQAKHGLEEQL